MLFNNPSQPKRSKTKQQRAAQMYERLEDRRLLAPVANDDVFHFVPGQTNVFDVLANDVPDQLPIVPTLTRLLTADSRAETLSFLAGGEGRWTFRGGDAKIIFEPLDGFNGVPSQVRYRIVETSGLESNIAVISFSNAQISDDHASSFVGATPIISKITPGSIEVPNDVDFFKFEAEAGQDYTFTVPSRFSSFGLKEMTLSLIDSTGTQVIAFERSNFIRTSFGISWTAPTSGTHFIRVDNLGFHSTRPTGTYDLIFEGPGTLVGDLGAGTAAVDNRVGTGFILFSEENVHTRFSDNPPHSTNADNMVAVFYENGQWFYDNNSGQYPFTPKYSDRLVAEVNFSTDTVTSLQGQGGLVNDIQQGYVDGDLVFFADQYAGASNDGEFEIEGTFFDGFIENDDFGDDISEAFTISRTVTSGAIESKGDIDVFKFDAPAGQYFKISTNGPVDYFSVTDLNGVPLVYGRDVFWVAPADGTYFIRVRGSSFNFGRYELELDGATRFVNSLRAGIAAGDDRAGTGYIMYSKESVHTRFADSPPIVSNSDHFVAVFFENNQWFFDNNGKDVPFSPLLSDNLVAEVDFTADTITSLEGLEGWVNGIHWGYLDGDLVFAANQYAGGFNAGEFKIVQGNSLQIVQPARRIISVPTTFQESAGNLLTLDTREGTGYVLYSEESVHWRFRANPPFIDNVRNAIAVIYENGQWYYDNNEGQFPFLPRSSDRLIAEIDFTADTIASLQGQRGSIHGIPQGYYDGDLRFRAIISEQEFDMSGSFFEIDTLSPRQRFGIQSNHGGGYGFVDATEITSTSTVGKVLKGEINHHKFESEAGREYLISLTTDAPGARDLALYDSSGVPVDEAIKTFNYLTGADTLQWTAPDSDTYYVLIDAKTSIYAQTTNYELTFAEQTLVGPRRSGIAAVDNRQGTGYIMFSEESVHSRFSSNPVLASNMDHLIAVLYEDGQWFYDNNAGQFPFVPRATDRLLFEVNFSTDKVVDLEGERGFVEGIAKGYVNGNLFIRANQFGGNVNSGEFEVIGGRYFTTDILAPAPNLGVAAVDGRKGTGYIMYSEQELASRFSSNPPVGTDSPNLIAVFYENNQWFYDNNAGQFAFTPRATDRLLAEVDFSSDSIESLEGVNAVQFGIQKGYQTGDLEFVANQYANKFNEGEFQVLGTYFDVDVLPLDPTQPSAIQQFQVGNLNRGIAALDTRQGDGFILYSEEDLHVRFAAAPPIALTSDHLISVFHQNGQWFYDNNATQIPFVPRDTDRLLAEVSFTHDAIQSLQGSEGIEHGIAKGYLRGDLLFYANRYGNSNDVGEFQVTGTAFVVSHQDRQVADIGSLNAGIAASDNREGIGYILYSQESWSDRFFSGFTLPSNSSNLITAVFQNNQWYLDNNQQLVPFTPTETDRLLAEVDFSNDFVTSFQGASGLENGIAKGYLNGDLAFFADQYAGQENDGEFQVTGSYFEFS